MQTVSSPISRERMCGGACSDDQRGLHVGERGGPMPPATSSAQASENTGAERHQCDADQEQQRAADHQGAAFAGWIAAGQPQPAEERTEDSAAAIIPTSVGETMKCWRPIGATRAE